MFSLSFMLFKRTYGGLQASNLQRPPCVCVCVCVSDTLQHLNMSYYTHDLKEQTAVFMSDSSHQQVVVILKSIISFWNITSNISVSKRKEKVCRVQGEPGLRKPFPSFWTLRCLNNNPEIYDMNKHNNYKSWAAGALTELLSLLNIHLYTSFNSKN